MASNNPPKGEPFDLMGNRIYFSDWSFVRPSEFGWYDDQGNNIAVIGDVGPDDARFETHERPFGIEIVTHKPIRSDPILAKEKAWESSNVLLHSIMQLDGRYRGWGYSWDKKVQSDLAVLNCHFHTMESEDGWHWTRPELGLNDYHGDSKTNILANHLNVQGGTVFHDPTEKCRGRFKIVGTGHMSRNDLERYMKERDQYDLSSVRDDVLEWDHTDLDPDKGMICCLVGGWSDDGYDWHYYDLPISVEHSDNQPTGYYDQRLGKYVIYTRTWTSRPLDPGTRQDVRNWINTRRSVGRSASEDFSYFPLSDTILTAGLEAGPSQVYYLNGRTSLPGAPDQHMMFPTLWDTSNDQTAVFAYSSADGFNWHLLPDRPMFETTAPGQPDGGCIFAVPNLIELPDGAIALPYHAHNVPHKYPRAKWEASQMYAMWPNGRLTGIKAASYGQFSTFAIIPPKDRMAVNLVTRRGGSVKFEVTDFDRNVIPGRSFDDCIPIWGDHRQQVVRWKDGDALTKGNGGPIMLRVRMDMAEISWIEFMD